MQYIFFLFFLFAFHPISMILVAPHGEIVVHVIVFDDDAHS